MKTSQIGVWSGILATSAMTFALFKLQSALNIPSTESLPPAKASKDAVASLPGSDALPTHRKAGLTLASHFGYGVACAELFAMFQRKADAPPMRAGMLFGIGVWAGSYFGLLPSMNSRAAALRLRPATNLQMLLAHMAWGASLGYAEHELRKRGDDLLAT